MPLPPAWAPGDKVTFSDQVTGLSGCLRVDKVSSSMSLAVGWLPPDHIAKQRCSERAWDGWWLVLIEHSGEEAIQWAESHKTSCHFCSCPQWADLRPHPVVPGALLTFCFYVFDHHHHQHHHYQWQQHRLKLDFQLVKCLPYTTGT